MIKITVTGTPTAPKRRRAHIEALSITDIAQGDLQEGQNLDFKRQVNPEKPEGKTRLLDDVVAFLNRGPARIIVGVEEKGGRFESFRAMQGDADQTAVRLQTIIQHGITPVPVDVQVVPLHLPEGFVLDIQIPQHVSGPFMNRLTGGYLVRSGARNLPIEPGMLRSRFVDEASWVARLNQFTADEDARICAGDRLVKRQAFRVAILPREHFDHQRDAFAQDDHVRYPGPVFHEHSDPWFKAAEDGHEIYAKDMRSQGIERLFVRDDWFVHAYAGFAIQQLSGEGRLGLYEFNEAVQRYLTAIAEFFAGQRVEGPFVVTLSLHGLAGDEHFGRWFKDISTVRTLRPRLVEALDDPALLEDFLRRVKQATVFG